MVVANVNGKNKWRFVVWAPERSQQSVDKEWKHRGDNMDS